MWTSPSVFYKLHTMKKGKIAEGIYPYKTLNWVMRPPLNSSVYPPAACEVNGELYQIYGFDSQETSYYVTEAKNLEEALNMSVDAYGPSTLNTVELAGLTAVCDRLGLDHAKIAVFQEKNIKGRQSFDTLRAVSSFCSVIKNYLAKKEVPLKTLGVFAKLPQNCREYIKNTVKAKDISVGDFRKLVNLLFDTQSRSEGVELSAEIIKKLESGKDKARAEFTSEFSRLTEGLAITPMSADSFETGRLSFTFTADSSDEYEEKIKKAAADSDKIKAVFRFLDEQNIS